MSKRPPKSLSRDWITEQFLLGDILLTESVGRGVRSLDRKAIADRAHELKVYVRLKGSSKGWALIAHYPNDMSNDRDHARYIGACLKLLHELRKEIRDQEPPTLVGNVRSGTLPRVPFRP